MNKHMRMSALRYGAAIAGVLLPITAWAAPADPPPGPPPLPGARIEADLAFLKTALKITDNQLAGWQPVADALRAQAKRRDAEVAAHRAATENPGPDGHRAPENLLDSLAEHQRLSAAEADDLAKLLTAVKPLYASLSADQKEVADELLPAGPPPHGPMGCPPMAPPPQPR